MTALEPEYGYAIDGAQRIGYQVIGEGPHGLVFPSGQIPVDLIAEHPAVKHFLERLASFSRVVLFDPRGWGASRAATENEGTVESWADDIGLVMDAVGMERAAIVGCGVAAFFSMYFAAAQPHHVSKLVLFDGFARTLRDDDYPSGMRVETLDRLTRSYQELYGTGIDLGLMLGRSLAADLATRQWWIRCERLGNSPQGAAKYWRELAGRDLRSVLSALRIPTLVLHRLGDQFVRVEHGRYLAEHIPGAKLVELDEDGHLFFAGDVDRLADEIELFLTGTTLGQDVDRILASVLYTDIVGSTDHAVAIGDRRWRQLLDRHDALTRTYVERFRGRVIKSTGDGALATFDGPARAIRCAFALRDAAGTIGLRLRAGIHTGEIETRDEDIGGIAVHLAARVQGAAEPDEVIVSRTVSDLVAGSGIEFDDRGQHQLKGIPGSWQLLAVKKV